MKSEQEIRAKYELLNQLKKASDANYAVLDENNRHKTEVNLGDALTVLEWILT